MLIFNAPMDVPQQGVCSSLHQFVSSECVSPARAQGGKHEPLNFSASFGRGVHYAKGEPSYGTQWKLDGAVGLLLTAVVARRMGAEYRLVHRLLHALRNRACFLRSCRRMDISHPWR